MEPPTTCKQLTSLWEECHTFKDTFHPWLSSSFHKLLKKNHHTSRARSSRKPFKSQDMLSSTLTMISPVKLLPLTLYLTSTSKSIGTLLQSVLEGVEHLVYEEISSRCRDELFFDRVVLLQTSICHIKASPILLANFLRLFTKSNSLKYLLSRPFMSVQIARWIVQLSELISLL